MKNRASPSCNLLSCFKPVGNHFYDEDDKVEAELRCFEKIVAESRRRWRPPVHRRILGKLCRSFQKKSDKRKHSSRSSSELSRPEIDTSSKMMTSEDDNSSTSSSLFSPCSSNSSFSPSSSSSSSFSSMSSPFSQRTAWTEPKPLQKNSSTSTATELISLPAVTSTIYDSANVLLIMAVSLSLFALFGGAWAVMCTSLLLWFVMTARNCDNRAKHVVASELLRRQALKEEEEKKKRVVMDGRNIVNNSSKVLSKKESSFSFWRNSFKVKKTN